MEENVTRPIQAISIATNRLEDLLEFYQMGFDLGKPNWKGKDHAGFMLNNIYFGFDRIKEKVKPGPGGPVIWFRVPNVEAAFTRLISLGAHARTVPEDSREVGETIAVVYDPDGNMVGLIGPI